MRRRALGLAFVACALLALAAPARAQSALAVRIREASLDPGGLVRLVVSVTGAATDQTLSSSNFAVSEQGRRITDAKVQPLLQSKSQPVAVVLAIDVSGSTAGRPLADAKSAAKSFVGQLPQGVRVGLVAFGERAQLRVPFTTNRSALNAAIDALQAGGGTSLYDAVQLASVTLSRTAAQHNIVLFSDGKDTASKVLLGQAIARAKAVDAPVTSVGLVTPDFDASALDRIAHDTGGRSLRVGQSASLASAFRQVAKDIASQYVITYTATGVGPKELELSVSASVGSATGADQIVVLNPRIIGGGSGGPSLDAPSAKPLVPAFAGKVGLYVGAGSVFVALMMFLGMLLFRPRESTAVKVLQRGLRLYTRSAGKREGQPESSSKLSASSLGRRAIQIVDKIPKKEYEAQLQQMLERAGWQLRASEFILLQAGGALAGLLLGWGLFGKWWLGLFMGIFGGAAPYLALKHRVAKRSTVFLSQLPDTLQLLAGSLQAGYGFMQGLDTLVKETSPPTSVEFSRVLTEARLGMPIEDALNAMADRIANEDFRWVVLAINIQRQVGGNLAVLLQTVAQTLREREQVRRQIKVLSAEGRLSGAILAGLPFAIAGYVMMVNPEYLKVLFSETIGKMMIAGALVFMGVGILWMKKLISIDV
jgi:tight adherence protein B